MAAPEPELVIQPDHIELMSAESIPAEPATPAAQRMADPAIPMADFAAAAEILRNRREGQHLAEPPAFDEDDDRE
jgi:hypothetical protein